MPKTTPITVDVQGIPEMVALVGDLYAERERAREAAALLEQELTELQERAAMVVRSLRTEPCECVQDCDDLEVCERCIRIAWLEPIPLIELDRMHAEAQS